MRQRHSENLIGTLPLAAALAMLVGPRVTVAQAECCERRAELLAAQATAKSRPGPMALNPADAVPPPGPVQAPSPPSSPGETPPEPASSPAEQLSSASFVAAHTIKPGDTESPVIIPCIVEAARRHAKPRDPCLVCLRERPVAADRLHVPAYRSQAPPRTGV